MKMIKNILLLCCISVGFVWSGFAQDNATDIKLPDRLNEREKLMDPQMLFRELQKKETDLNAREADLNARETRIKTLEQSLITRETELKKMRQDITDRLKELEGKESAELDKLAKIYAATKPKSAAAIFIEMEPDKAVAVFRRMTPSAVAKILNEISKINPAHASKISEGLGSRPTFN